MLKVIEEPNENTFFILIHDISKKILDTIKSRSCEFRIYFSQDKRKIIFNKLIEQCKIDLSINEINNISYFDTPGNLLNYLLIYENENLKFSNDNLKNALYFMDRYKAEKDSQSFFFLSLFIEKFYNELYLKTNIYINKHFFNYSKILKLLQDMKRFNLDINNTLFLIKDILLNATR